MTSKVWRYEQWPELFRSAWSRGISSQPIPLNNQLETWGVDFFESWLLFCLQLEITEIIAGILDFSPTQFESIIDVAVQNSISAYGLVSDIFN